MRFRAIADNYSRLEQVQDALRREGLESSNLIVAIDFTKSNEWTGKHSFGGRSLHALGPTPSPYEEAIATIGRTLAAFDDDGLIPCYGFGDVTTSDKSVFSFMPGDQPCQGLDSVVWRYRELCPYVRLAGPTSFAPAINQAAKIVADSGGQYHILVIVADGQVSRPSDLAPGQLGSQEQATVDAIVAASLLPLSIIMVGVGDGPWDLMREFDDALPARAFDNFQFVNYGSIAQACPPGAGPEKREALFALRALMEVPEQFKAIQRLGMLGRRPVQRPRGNPPLDPPIPISAARPPSAPPAAAAPPPRPHASSSASGAPPLPPVYETAAQAAAAGGGPSASSPGMAAAAGASMSLAPDPLYICPITQEVMDEPVLAADGFTYDRPAITSWLSSHDTSPMTNARLDHKHLIPNHALRSAIMEWRERQAKAGGDGARAPRASAP